MIKKLRTWHIIGAIVIFGLAALWHFVYAWIPSGVSAFIFPVNESIWEHVKLFFFPAIIYFTIEYFAVVRPAYKKEASVPRNYLFAHGLSLISMPAIALALFYGYRDVLGIAESLLIDIILTFVAICIGLFIAYKMTISQRKMGKSVIAYLIALVLCVAYGLLTFFPPKTPMFLDTNTNGYGIEGFDADHDHDGDHGAEDHEEDHGGEDHEEDAH